MLNPKEIPGLIEPIEQQMLTEQSQALSLQPDEVLVEFGTFFGRSTACIYNGLVNNPHFRLLRASQKQGIFRAFDGFQYKKETSFGALITKMADRYGLSDLMKEDQGMLNFQGIFEHLMQPIPDQQLETNACMIEQALHNGRPIRMMHLDMPNHWHEYEYIVDQFFPSLVNGATIVFQDFFYHRAATLSSAIFLWIEQGLFTPTQTAASSLVVKVNGPIGTNEVEQLKQAMQSANCSDILNRANRYFLAFNTDRKAYFANRLLVANFFYEFCMERHDKAQLMFRKLMEEGTINNPGIYGDIVDLVGTGFQ